MLVQVTLDALVGLALNGLISLKNETLAAVINHLQHLNRLTSYRVGYRSFTEQYFDSCGIFRDAVIAIVATVAKQERVRISERVKAGLETARAKGKKLGRPRVSPDCARIATLRNTGRSWPQIAKELGVGVGTVYRAYQELSKNPKAESLSRNLVSASVAAD